MISGQAARRCAFAFVFALSGCFAVTASAQAQVLEPLTSFTGCAPFECGSPSEGGIPNSTLVRGPDGLLYGTAGAPCCFLAHGTIYRVNADDSRTVIHNFADGDFYANGSGPWGKLAFGPDGTIYGLAGGGSDSSGVLFRLGASLTVLHHFPDPDFLPPGSSDGASPSAIAFGSDGHLYGTTFGGGTAGHGTVFRLDGSTVSFIHSFGAPLSGLPSQPFGDLLLASDGNIYGVSYNGGENNCNGIGCGTAFRITSGGSVQVVHNFTLASGGNPNSGLTEGSDGYLYGVTFNTIFRLSLDGMLTTLKVVPGSGGHQLTGNLVQAIGGDLYGTASGGGANNYGTVFRLAVDGTFTTLHSFTGTDGRLPGAGLAQGFDGHLYGTTMYGGSADVGTLFRIRMPAAVAVTANRLHLPQVLEPGDPLDIAVAFFSASSAPLNPAAAFLALGTPWGTVYWLTPAGFSTTAAALYVGPLPSFSPLSFIQLPNSSVLPPGDYSWVPIVYSAATGVLYDVVVTTIPGS